MTVPTVTIGRENGISWKEAYERIRDMDAQRAPRS